MNFVFQDTYNSHLKVRYEEDSLTYPDFDSNLWLEERLFCGHSRIGCTNSLIIQSRT